MLQIDGLSEGVEIFKVLGSEVRLRIVELLSTRGQMNLNELAQALELTGGALTSHIRKLEECGIIRVTQENSGRGTQKVCSLAVTQMLLNIYPAVEESQIKLYETEIRVGHYSDYKLNPGCGIASAEGMVGEADDPRAFAYPERMNAEMLWFHNGYVEYRIPNLLPEQQQIVQLTLSFEISSGDYSVLSKSQSEIFFLLNGQRIGSWISFEDQESPRGIYTPYWWVKPERQHGFLKMIVINHAGTFLDGKKISDEGLGKWKLDENSDIRFRFETWSTPEHDGGLALYGSGFGNYNQNIHARIHYMPEDLQLVQSKEDQE